MARDWIKMRGGLFNSPKLIAMSRSLHEHREFREWLTPGGSGSMNGQLVSDHALRCVTGALLCVTWSWSREFGKERECGDCFLPHIELADLDGIAGAPFVGESMASVGWARTTDDPSGVILPNFFGEYNVPLTPAEKQERYRDRKRQEKSVTKPLPCDGNKTVTREEKRRVYKKEIYKERKSPPSFDESLALKALPERVRTQKVIVILRHVAETLAARGKVFVDPTHALVVWAAGHANEDEFEKSARVLIQNEYVTLTNYATPKAGKAKSEPTLKPFKGPNDGKP